MADRSWLEFSDDDEGVDSEEARKIIEARLRKRREEAERMSAPSTRRPLQRSATVNYPGELPGVDSRSRARPRGALKRGNCYGLKDSFSSSTSATSFSPTSSGAFSPSAVSLTRPSTPSYTVDGDDIVFSEVYDIWFTDPAVVSTRGTSKDLYANACCFVGSFRKISEFYAFHNAIDWDNIPDGSVVAYCKKDIKPQWEAPINVHGGRFMCKHFPRRFTEKIFTKIALGFLSGLLTDWPNFNLVSLHVRSASRGTDIQLWRRIGNSSGGLTTSIVLNDIKALVVETAEDADTFGAGAVNWMPNSGSVQKNDHRINQHRQRQGLRSASSVDTGMRYMQDNIGDIFAGGRIGGRGAAAGSLPEDLRRAMIAAADAELAHVTPQGLGFKSEEIIQEKQINAKPKRCGFRSLANVLSEQSASVPAPTAPTGSRSKKANDDHAGFVKSTPTLRRTQNVTVQKPISTSHRKFCFTQVAELLPSSTDASQSCSEAGTESDSSKKQMSKLTLSMKTPYPAYDAPLSMHAWHRGQALREQGGQ